MLQKEKRLPSQVFPPKIIFAREIFLAAYLAPEGRSRKLNVGVTVWGAVRCEREDNGERTSRLVLARETS